MRWSVRLRGCARFALMLLVVATLDTEALAQSFPTKPVRIVIPFPPGGGVDLLARTIAAELGPRWGQNVLVENRAGGNSVVGAEYVARAPADGHTLLMTVNTTLTTNPFLLKSLPYDPARSFAPITLVAQGAMLVLAHPSVAAQDLRELVGLARRLPGSLNYASFGPGTQSQLIFESMNRREDIRLVHVPYKGIAPAVTATIAGETQLVVASPGSIPGGIANTRLRPLAIAGRARSPLFPHVPTTSELGYPYAQALVWMAILAPAGAPSAIVDRIQRDVTAIVREPEFAAKHITGRGWEVVASNPDQLATTIRDELAAMGELFRAADIRPE